ncbi:DUF6612 family protein [Abiotrophia defectiva]|uniref:DUF6612 family protein n=1 Tax=Abiotrophia defectiva TaxID=46125 RepID=UPI0026ED5A2C|nr:DUF6612 family protein [Abiotrophia defectiva]
MKHLTKHLLVGCLGLSFLVNYTGQSVAARPPILDASSEESSNEESSKASEGSSLISEETERMTFPELQDKLEQARQKVLSVKITAKTSRKTKEFSVPSEDAYIAWNKFEVSDDQKSEPVLSFNHEELNLAGILKFEYFLTKRAQDDYLLYTKSKNDRASYRQISSPFAEVNYQDILTSIILLDAPYAKVELKDSSYHVYISDKDQSLTHLFLFSTGRDKVGQEMSSLELIIDQKDFNLKGLTYYYQDDQEQRSAELSVEDINQVSEKDLTLAPWTQDAVLEEDSSSDRSELSDETSETADSSQSRESSPKASQIMEEVWRERLLSSVFMSFEKIVLSDDKTNVTALEGDMAYNKVGQIVGLHYFGILDQGYPDGRFVEIIKSLNDKTFYGRLNTQWYTISAAKTEDIKPEYQRLLTVLADKKLTEKMTVEESGTSYLLKLEGHELGILGDLSRDLLMDLTGTDSNERQGKFSLTVEVSKKEHYLQSLDLKVETQIGGNPQIQHAKISFSRYNKVSDMKFELPSEAKDARPIEELSSSQESNW